MAIIEPRLIIVLYIFVFLNHTKHTNFSTAASYLGGHQGKMIETN